MHPDVSKQFFEVASRDLRYHIAYEVAFLSEEGVIDVLSTFALETA